MKRAINSAILWAMIVLLLGVFLYQPLFAGTSIQLNKGGFVAAMGQWKLPVPSWWDYLKPVHTAATTLLLAATTFYLTGTWQQSPRGECEGRLWMITYTLAIAGAFCTAASMIVHYETWHRMRMY